MPSKAELGLRIVVYERKQGYIHVDLFHTQKIKVHSHPGSFAEIKYRESPLVSRYSVRVTNYPTAKAGFLSLFCSIVAGMHFLEVLLKAGSHRFRNTYVVT